MSDVDAVEGPDGHDRPAVEVQILVLVPHVHGSDDTGSWWSLPTTRLLGSQAATAPSRRRRSGSPRVGLTVTFGRSDAATGEDV